MSGIIAAMENQIGKCKKLLAIFQTERRLYHENRSLGVKDLVELLRRKKEIVEAFEEQQNVLRQINMEEQSIPEEVREKKKTLVRDLAEILEQLLVIDRENEKIIKEMLHSSGGQPRRSAPAPAAEQPNRPGLQTRLPFVPGASFPRQFARPAAPQEPAPAPKAPPRPSAPNAAELAARVQSVMSGKKTEPVRKMDDGVVKYKPKSFLRGYTEASHILQLNSKYA